MLTPTLPSNNVNALSVAVIVRTPVGEANIEAQGTPFQPVEGLSSSGRALNRTSTAELAVDAEANTAVATVRPRTDEDSSDLAVNEKPVSEEEQAEQKAKEQQLRNEAEKQQLEADQELIQQLLQRDREVRAHEQAHAAVGGQLSGAPSYQYERGPDGVRYAVSGEVPISNGAVPGDPEATLQNARIVQRAALAPAEPSPQDRRVAAEAAQLEQQAIQEIAIKAQEAQQQEAADRNTEESDSSATASNDPLAPNDPLESASGSASELAIGGLQDANSNKEDPEQDERTSRLDDFVQTNIDLNRRLIDIGVSPSPVEIGSFFDQIA